MYANRHSRRHRHAAFTIALAGVLAGACSQHPTASTTHAATDSGRALLQVSVTPAALRLTVGDTVVLRAEVRDRYGNLVPDLVPTWETNAAAVVIVSPDGSQARVIGIGAGEARVTARANDATGAASLSVSAFGTPPQL